MNTANIQCLTVEIAPSQVIEVDCEVRAIPAGDLAALENVKKATEGYAADALKSAQEAQLDADSAAGSAHTASQHRQSAEDAAQRALNSSIDAEENSDLAKTAAELAELTLAENIKQVELATAQADRSTAQADLATDQATLASQIRTETGQIRDQTQTIHDNTQQLADEALTELDSTTQAIRDEMVQLEVNVNDTTQQAVDAITAQFIPLATAVINTQTIVTEHHSFR